MYRGKGIIWQNGCTFKLNAPELGTFVDRWRDSEHNGGKRDRVVWDRNERFDKAIIHMLEVSFVDLHSALPRLTQLAEFNKAADPNRDHSSNEWASFSFIRLFGKYMRPVHSLKKLSSKQAWLILAFRPV